MAELARDFSYERDLAFFVVQIGLSRAEFDMLTEKEKMFIRKEHENKFMKDTTWTRNAVLNAEANINRKKGKKFIELFPKKNLADKEYNENAVKNILEMEATKGKGWVDLVYKANGMKKPIPKGKG
ncbi:phenylalanine racemase [Bacillus sp. MRMR6]|uniref:phenylalanine racemase n=1 Tax=Bacillus sp. MRMR6 TaxID=1928617 RepID=UPI0009534A0C|nr:phenylalanine racemase [Bacillus sp. MRMR6]OLS39142.1 phenylalanine racemase [Bacillus sp. MRMR6]